MILCDGNNIMDWMHMAWTRRIGEARAIDLYGIFNVSLSARPPFFVEEETISVCRSHTPSGTFVWYCNFASTSIFFCKRALAYFTREYSILPDCMVKWDSEPGKTGRKFRHIATSTIISNSLIKSKT